MRLTQEQHDRAARIAYERMYAKNWQIDSDDDAIAMALISNFGRGPWEEQAKRLTEWANEREERFGAVRSVLDSFGIGVDRGNLEDQVKALAAKVRRDVAKEITDRIDDSFDLFNSIAEMNSMVAKLRADYER
jgi:hypothetical protein